jgi:hypothetical protein
MTNSLEAMIARILKLATLAEQTNINESSESWVAYLNEVSPANVRELIAALEQAQQEFKSSVRRESSARAKIDEQQERIDELELECDRNYIYGMKTGWNYCDAGNSDGFNKCVEQRRKLTREANPTEARQLSVKLPALNDDLIEIIGRPNFQCSPVAECLRIGGAEIRRKSENEQAAVIHWMLGLYLEHGDKWREMGNVELQRIKAAAGGTVEGSE